MLYSLRQAFIFPTETNAPIVVGAAEFPDFYALIQTRRDASSREIEDAIKSAGSLLLAASLRRGNHGERVEMLREHIHDLRPILLHIPARALYDEQLLLHSNGDERAVNFQTWRKMVPQPGHFERATRGLTARLRYAFWEAEYM